MIKREISYCYGKQNSNNLSASIILVTYNGSLFLRNLFRSINDQTVKNFELIIIDNASTDNTLKLCLDFIKESPSFDVRLILLSRNVGYAKACNLGARKARSDGLVFLNQDIILEKDWFENLIREVNKCKEVGIVGSFLLDSERREIGCGGIYDVYGAVRNTTLGEAPFFVYGCAMFIRKAVFQRLGGMDEQLFMYKEDADICWRGRIMGVPIICATKARCVHIGEDKRWKMILRPSPDAFYNIQVKNRLRVLLKNLPCKILLWSIPITLMLIMLRTVFLCFYNRNPYYFVAFVKGIIWNILNLVSTIKERKKLTINFSDRMNVVSRLLLSKPIEITLFPLALKWKKVLK